MLHIPTIGRAENRVRRYYVPNGTFVLSPIRRSTRPLITCTVDPSSILLHNHVEYGREAIHVHVVVTF